MIPLIVLACLVCPIWGAEIRVVEPPLRVDLQPPQEARFLDQRFVSENWMQMPIDHFDPQNNATFNMRYMVNELYFGEDGSPIFIMVGGEWDISPAWLLTGNMFEMARENNGCMIYTEHRYYGQSLPYEVFSTSNLKFLNVDQALADLAYFINTYKRSSTRFANSKVILYGGSYAGNMALWFKQRYPHLAVGVVASSGPIKGQVNFEDYLNVVHRAFLSEGGEECIAAIKLGIDDTLRAMETEGGRRELESAYRLCAPLDYDNRFALGYFSGLISWTFSTSVQQSRPGTLLNICNNFATNIYGETPMQKIGGYIAAVRNLGPACWMINYETYVNNYMVPRSNSRAWYYQTCTEYGYYQTAPNTGTVFDHLNWLNVEFYVDMCKRAFDERFNELFVYDAVERVNLVFGGLSPEVNKTINIHGELDPWFALGVHRDLQEDSPTYSVPRASHCFDMQPWLPTDTILMTRAQQDARRLVAQWLSEN
ncbi:putative serine protease K12H4.7 [Hyposmocoma kahamanoa]|uniref:putative serine protease K12H4.7 n=1 Tax=Hyposmocoma kahamanoa TaxID=1477025 RepID=UPI000E6D6C55|nr:putative serine protease K12H4.7 [Hyposmocoma kahamanoa]